jgi:hypothetical protein
MIISHLNSAADVVEIRAGENLDRPAHQHEARRRDQISPLRRPRRRTSILFHSLKNEGAEEAVNRPAAPQFWPRILGMQLQAFAP